MSYSHDDVELNKNIKKVTKRILEMLTVTTDGFKILSDKLNDGDQETNITPNGSPLHHDQSANPATPFVYSGTEMPTWIKDLIREKKHALRCWHRKSEPYFFVLYKKLRADVKRAVKDHRTKTLQYLHDLLFQSKNVEDEDNKNCPKTDKFQRPKLPGWIRRLIVKKNRAQKDWESTGDPTFRDLYNKLNANIKHAVQKQRNVTPDNIGQLFPSRSNNLELNNKLSAVVVRAIVEHHTEGSMKLDEQRLATRLDATTNIKKRFSTKRCEPIIQNQSSVYPRAVYGAPSCNLSAEAYRAELPAWIRDLFQQENCARKDIQRDPTSHTKYNKLCADVKRAVEEFRDVP